MRTTHSLKKTAIATGILIAGASALMADVRDDEIHELRDQIQQLSNKLDALERKEEIREANPASSASTAPVASAGSAAKPSSAPAPVAPGKVIASDKGISLQSADAANTLKIRGLVQADGRFFVSDSLSNNDAFLIRRARLVFEGNFANFYQYQIVPEFGGTSGNGTLTLLDANITIAPTPELQLKAGRFREPVGLEQLQTDSHCFFAERSIVSQFVPNRDIGVQLGGDILGGHISYAAGVFDGVADAANNATNTDTNNDKDFAARIIASPFKGSGSLADGLSFGIAGSVGRQNSLNGSTGALTGGYKTDGQQTWFTYRSTAVAQGLTWRISPQADYYHGPLGLMAEYVISDVTAINGKNRQALENKAWQVSGGYVITGENASYNGVVPKTNFSPADGTWGALEVVGRIENASIDRNAFVGGANSLASNATSARGATAFSVGLNWYLSKTVRASFDYFNTDFRLASGGAPVASSPIYTNENAFLTRLQLLF